MKHGGSILVYSEREDVALELLSAGRTLADQIGADLITVVLGHDAETLARDNIARGADIVLVAAAGLESIGAGLQVEALQRALLEHRVGTILIGATTRGTEIAARLAQKLAVGCATDCSDLILREGGLEIERRTLGRFVCRQIVETRPAMATVQPRRYRIPAREEWRSGRIQSMAVEEPESGLHVLGSRVREGSNVRVDKADIVVAVGRGLRSKDDLPMIEELARAIGGVVGASRPLTDDLQWLPTDVKIGLSGVSVRPKLYVACGISGQIEHHVGMRESAVVVAINSDPGAPIMDQADYRVSGDLYELIPLLTQALREIGVTPKNRST